MTAAAFHLLGFLVTLLSVAFLGAGGYLAAVLLTRSGCGDQARRDPLLLAIATLLLATAQAVAIGLLLGGAGMLGFEPALGLQILLVLVLFLAARRRTGEGEDLTEPARRVLGRGWARLREYPVLALIALHAGGTELLRGLLRPPLSWDSLMYHLFLAGTWLQQGSFELVAARHPTTFYQFMPGNGSLWLWWWMVPSHSELYVNVAFLPQWLLLGLATGAFARALGARRHWPVAAFLVLLVPTVVRFVATQYVDVAVGSYLVAGSVFALRWLREPRRGDALLIGVAGGLAAGTKVLAIPFAAGLALMILLLAREQWRRRIPQIAAMALVAALLGGYFYVRNLTYGGGPFGFACAQQDESAGGGILAGALNPSSPAANLPDLLANRSLVGAFLGVTRPTMAELGIGPAALLLLPVVLLLPLWFRGAGGAERRASWLAFGQLAVQALFWMTATYAVSGHVLANVRYLVGGIGLALAAAVALGERHLAPAWLRLLAIAFAVQDLLMLNPRMPYPVRVALAWALVAAAVLALWPGLRRWLWHRRRPVAAALAVLLLAAVPPWASFRLRDRARSFGQDYVAHLSSTRLFAAGWGWLDAHAGDDPVAVSHAPENFFVYPAMGPYLRRRALYVHVNEAAHVNPLRYPDCKTRVDPSIDAWIANLRERKVRWLHLGRYPELDFPLEDRWAASRPDLFALRFDHPTNRIYELLPAAAE